MAYHSGDGSSGQKASFWLTRRQLLQGGGVALVGLMLGQGQAWAAADARFLRWVEGFRQTARAAGIRDATFAKAFAGIDRPDETVLQKAAWQPEFKDPAWNYFDNRLGEDAVKEGRIQAQKWANWLTAIEKRFGVHRHILLAIWSMETNYGAALTRSDAMLDAIRSLATLAYGDTRRAKFGQNQLLAALKILQQGEIKREHLAGSWAGALGHTQFIPTSYLRYAVDMDGDGRRDLWHSVPDALASSANLLAENGWVSGRGWGYEVLLPQTKKFPAGHMPIRDWQKWGLKRANGREFPHATEQATLKLPDGREGPVFLVTQNFFSIKRYNNADRYAFAVGILADRIGGYHGPVRDWNRPFTPLDIADRLELQRHLATRGFYHGEIDGQIGAVSRQAIEAYQRQKGVKVDGYPSRDLLLLLRKN